MDLSFDPASMRLRAGAIRPRNRMAPLAGATGSRCRKSPFRCRDSNPFELIPAQNVTDETIERLSLVFNYMPLRRDFSIMTGGSLPDRLGEWQQIL